MAALEGQGRWGSTAYRALKPKHLGRGMEEGEVLKVIFCFLVLLTAVA